MKGIKKNGMYVLLGKSCVGFVNSSINSLIDKTKLWHKILGHISEKGLHYLDKQYEFGKDKVRNLIFVKFAS